MRHYLNLFLFLHIVLISGCQKEIECEEPMWLVFVNKTDYSVDVILKGEGMIYPELSASIPKNSNSNATITVPIKRFPTLSSCTFVFEDGKTIEYVSEADISQYENNNPIWLESYYSQTDIGSFDGRYYFNITDNHYQLVE